MLNDTESVFIDSVGLRDLQYAKDHYAFGVPRASVRLRSPDGTVRAKLVSADCRHRPGNECVLAMVESLANQSSRFVARIESIGRMQDANGQLRLIFIDQDRHFDL